jgi:hypothetical protein
LLNPDPDQHSNCGSVSRRAKMPHKNKKKSRIFLFLSTGTGCSLLRADGFSCSLGVLYGDLGISKLQFLIKKYKLNLNIPDHISESLETCFWVQNI